MPWQTSLPTSDIAPHNRTLLGYGNIDANVPSEHAPCTLGHTAAKQELRLRTDRRDRQVSYLVTNERLDVDIEELGRELGVLKPWEKLED